MTPEWEDVTSYQRGQRGKIEPTSWQCTVKGVRLFVSCGHRDYRPKWVLISNKLEMERLLAATTKEQAQFEALCLVEEALKQRIAELIESKNAIEEVMNQGFTAHADTTE